jgi:hypothetical protein
MALCSVSGGQVPEPAAIFASMASKAGALYAATIRTIMSALPRSNATSPHPSETRPSSEIGDIQIPATAAMSRRLSGRNPMTNDERRLLELLADRPNGSSEALLLARGFSPKVQSIYCTPGA